MSYEESYRTPYKATCACGNGFLRYYKIVYSNDFGQDKEDTTPVEICCESCKEKYHVENEECTKYLIPNGLTFPKKEPRLDYGRYLYDFKEKIVGEYGKEGIEEIISDMTAPKHRYAKDLTTTKARRFVNEWLSHYKSKKLSNMIDFLRVILMDFDNIKGTYEKKRIIQEKYFAEREAYEEEVRKIRKQSFELKFEYDKEQDDRAKREREEYEEAHKYDDFTATVKYDKTFRKDLVNHHWDTYLIKECIDPQYLVLSRPIFGLPEVLITKKYKCVCQICNAEREILSSEFKISNNSEVGYYPEPCCSCHKVSSFEAKVMEILNNLGITYIREKTFEGLVGDSGGSLRFDFALCKNQKDAEESKIDLVIELHGPHHYQVGYYDDDCGDYITDDTEYNNTQRATDTFEKQIRYDNKKREFCLANGINIEYIKYTVSGDYDGLERKLVKILKQYGYQYMY